MRRTIRLRRREKPRVPASGAFTPVWNFSLALRFLSRNRQGRRE